MKRFSVEPRPDWRKKVEDAGFIFHTLDDVPYWDESAYYFFTSKEIDDLERATNELYEMFLGAGQHVLDNWEKYRGLFAIPELVAGMVFESWEQEPPSIYGRFDFAYKGEGYPPKLLEFNADTPTSLLEASVIQWYWLQEKFPASDQFNSIHEKLIAKWKELKDYITGEILHFSSLDMIEDVITVNYLRDTADQAGFTTEFILIENIGFDEESNSFRDMSGREIKSIFKLYPWEFMYHDEFGRFLPVTKDKVQWIEPAWKMLWSNKAILPVLWELFPGHPYLLESYFDGPRGMQDYVKKPILAREGANVRIFKAGRVVESSEGAYGEEGFIYQRYAQLREFEGNHPVIGSWLVDGVSAGIGIRENKSGISDNFSRFVPHRFTPGV